MDDLPSHWQYDFRHGTVGTYLPASAADRAVFRRFATETKGWDLLTDKPTIKIWDKAAAAAAGRDVTMIRVKVLMEKIQPSVVYDVLHDPIYRPLWDASMGEGYTLETIDTRNDVNYFLGKSPVALVDHRDFCNLRSWWHPARPTGSPSTSSDEPNDHPGESSTALVEFGIFSRSVPHVKCPKRKGIVRAISYLTGALIKPHPKDDQSTVLTYVTQTDMGGRLPQRLTDFLTRTFVPDFVSNLDKAARAYPKWKAQNEPDKKPWLSD